MFFETAGIEIAIWVPPVTAFVISFFTSMGGLSGAFLLLPFQMSVLGYTAPSVSATNQLFNLIAIPGGVYRYWKEGRVVWPLTWAVVAGTLPGVVVGAFVRIVWLPDPKAFSLFAAGVLLYIGLRLVADLRRERRRAVPGGDRLQRPGEHMHEASSASLDHVVGSVRWSWKTLGFTFRGRRYTAALPAVVLAGFVAGVVGAIYGIGGGAIVAPLLVSVFGLPVYTIAGATLLGTFVASGAAVVAYHAFATLHPGVPATPDWLLGALFGAGGIAGMYLGARCQKFVSPRLIKWMLAAVTVFTALRYAAAYVR